MRKSGLILAMAGAALIYCSGVIIYNNLLFGLGLGIIGGLCVGLLGAYWDGDI